MESLLIERPVPVSVACETKIQESKLAELELEESRDFAEVFEFDFGVVECPKAGKGRLKGTIPLMTKYKNFNWEKQPKLKKYFIDYLFEKGIVWSKKEQEVLDVGIIAGVVINSDPTLDLEDPIIVMAAAYCTAMYYVDDLMDNGFMGDSVTRQRSEEVVNFLDSVFKKLDDDTVTEVDNGKHNFESCTIPALQPVIHLISLVKDLYKIVFPEAERTKDHERLQQDQKDAIICQYILCDPELRESISAKGFAFLRRYNINLDGGLAFCALTRKIVLRDMVRTHVLYRIIHDIFSNMLALFNDLFGILKDISVQEKHSFVLLDAHTGVSLETAFKNRNHELIELTKDFCKLSQKLCENYSDDEDLAAYIQYTKEVWSCVACLADLGRKRYNMTEDNVVITLRPLDPLGVFGI